MFTTTLVCATNRVSEWAMALLMCVGLAACGGDSGNNASTLDAAPPALTGAHLNAAIAPLGDTGAVVTTLAGTAGVFGSADGSGAAAQFAAPFGIAVDTAGNLYVTDSNNHNIRKITAAGVVTTLAGTAGVVGSADGMGAAAQFNQPLGIAADTAGNVYVADANNHTIRKITAAGVVTTLAGTAGVVGRADGIGAAAQFAYVTGIAVDTAGNLYVEDFSFGTIRKITAAGVVTTLAGTAGVAGLGIAADTTGNLYVADTGNQTIIKITAAGVVTTLAGTAGVAGSADGSGAAARFNNPYGIAADTAGNLYVADAFNSTIRKITAAGVVTTLAGTAGVTGSVDGSVAAARFSTPVGIAVDTAGNLYVADAGNSTIRKITLPVPIVAPPPPTSLTVEGLDITDPTQLAIIRSRPTVVLTHGLNDISPFPTDPDSLWIGLKDPNTNQFDFTKAAALIRSTTPNVNIVQFVWHGAYQVKDIPDRLEYYRAQQLAPNAGVDLARRLLSLLGSNYSKSVHFVGHSMGTIVNANAANLFLANAPNVSYAQFTALDRPDHVNDLPKSQLDPSLDPFGKNLGLPEPEVKFLLAGEQDDAVFEIKYGFHSSFFAAFLQGLRPPCTGTWPPSSPCLRIDNYYSLDGPRRLLTTIAAGVGDVADGPVYNHHPDPNKPQGLVDPAFLGRENPLPPHHNLFSEGVSNSHSGVHQWYRWTINPNRPEFTLLNAGQPYCDANRQFSGLVVQGISADATLNPCASGWYWSLNGPHPEAFPPNNGNPVQPVVFADLQLASVALNGCTTTALGAIVTISCVEQSSPSLDAQVNIPPNAEFLSFQYSFPNTGDGDYVAVLLDDAPVWVIAGSSSLGSTLANSGLIPIAGFTGTRKLTVQLFGVGEKNAAFSVQKFQVSTATVGKLGDVDLDGDVDSNDLARITSALNTNASGPNDLRDLDGDGKITALDARKLVLLCTRPRCATR